MRIAAFKPGHDGSAALVEGSRLVFSLEAEKDSFPRFSDLGPQTFLDFLAICDRIPDIVCMGGWPKGFHSSERPQGPGYFGIDSGSFTVQKTSVFGAEAHLFMSTHERSHIWCSYGLSPFPNGEPVICLIWEGNIGRFYLIDRKLEISGFDTVISDPGNKYSFLYGVADPSFPEGKGKFRFESAGKMMALAAYGSDRAPTRDEEAVVEWVLSRQEIVLNHGKEDLKGTPLYNSGVETQIFKDMARQITNAIYDRFIVFAERNLPKGLPLVVGGGCGLNCEWNSRLRNSGLFSDVFVPPMVNDSGSAIGTAVDAKRHFGGNAKVEWSPYCGLALGELGDPENWLPYDPSVVAADLLAGNVVAFLNGRCESGPRALGHRSIFAEPFSSSMRERLNHIKGREQFRPIAPIVLAEDAALYFALDHPSPYMLHFCKVIDRRLEAITHVDGTARPQTVADEQEPTLAALLRSFRGLSGVSVLCNTSLNFSGRGFINHARDALEFCSSRGIDAVVFGNYFRRITR